MSTTTTDELRPTKYIVLRRVSHPQDAPGASHRWEHEGSVEAASADAAVRKYLSGATTAANSTTFVAVPARSWKPVTVETEQRVVVKLNATPEEDA